LDDADRSKDRCWTDIFCVEFSELQKVKPSMAFWMRWSFNSPG
jgi:hypothetical protein